MQDLLSEQCRIQYYTKLKRIDNSSIDKKNFPLSYDSF